MKKIFAFILVVLFLSGCAKGSGPSAATLVPATTPGAPATDTSYPAASQNQGFGVTPGYPAATNAPVIVPTWTTAPGTGVVSGVLKVHGKPVKGILLYLGTFLKNSAGQEFTAVVEPAKSPSTNTDESGNFTFINLQPGRYSLIMDNVAKQYLLYKPNSKDYIAIDLPAGGKVDLGTLDYSDLPVPQNNQ